MCTRGQPVGAVAPLALGARFARRDGHLEAEDGQHLQAGAERDRRLALFDAVQRGPRDAGRLGGDHGRDAQGLAASAHGHAEGRQRVGRLWGGRWSGSRHVFLIFSISEEMSRMRNTF